MFHNFLSYLLFGNVIKTINLVTLKKNVYIFIEIVIHTHTRTHTHTHF